jgi:orotidine-5'-phosphate decarboxylase
MKHSTAKFIHALNKLCLEKKSILCVGLDPQPSLHPLHPGFANGVFNFNRAIIDATHDLVCAYKPNLAFYEALGLEGLDSLEKTMQYIRQNTNALVIGDGKRGDVEHTAKAYAKTLFEVWGFDATTVNAYGGYDSILPFLGYEDKGTFIWCRSSNPGAVDIQDLPLSGNTNGRSVYEQIAINANEWNDKDNIGLIMGATYPHEIKVARSLCPTMPFLVPGVGAQKGALESTVKNGIDSNGLGILLSSSRQIIYASTESDYAQAAREAAQTFNARITRILFDIGKGLG